MYYSSDDDSDVDDPYNHMGFLSIPNDIVNRPRREHTSYLSTFARLACGKNSIATAYSSPKNDPTVVTATCPRFWATDEHGEVKCWDSVVSKASDKDPGTAKQMATKGILEQLVKLGFACSRTGEPTHKVTEPRLTVPGTREQIPLGMKEEVVRKLPLFTIPSTHTVHLIETLEQLDQETLESRLSITTIAPKKQPHVLGFDAEWRPMHSRTAALSQYTSTDMSADMCVVQFSSEHASVVLNLLSLGNDLGRVAQAQSKAAHQQRLAEIRREHATDCVSGTSDAVGEPEICTGNVEEAMGQLTVGPVKKVLTDRQACGDALALVVGIMNREDVVKCGVACSEDAKRMARMNRLVKPKCVSDVVDIARKLEFQKLGLRALAASLLSVRLGKGEQMTDWQQLHLSQALVEYAAADSLVSRMVHERLTTLHRIISTTLQ